MLEVYRPVACDAFLSHSHRRWTSTVNRVKQAMRYIALLEYKLGCILMPDTYQYSPLQLKCTSDSIHVTLTREQQCDGQ